MGPKTLAPFKGAKGRTIYACYGCMGRFAEEDDTPILVLTARLFKAYDFVWPATFTRMTLRSIRRYAPVAEFMAEVERSDPDLFNTPKIIAYDYGRVRHFVSQLIDGAQLDPIDVDNDCADRVIYPRPIVVDGHHRLWAYRLARRRYIPVNYAGRLDVLDYLKGLRPKPPTDPILV